MIAKLSSRRLGELLVCTWVSIFIYIPVLLHRISFLDLSTVRSTGFDYASGLVFHHAGHRRYRSTPENTSGRYNAVQENRLTFTVSRKLGSGHGRGEGVATHRLEQARTADSAAVYECPEETSADILFVS